MTNLEYFEMGYAAIWIILFAYLVFLHIKIARIERPKS